MIRAQFEISLGNIAGWIVELEPDVWLVNGSTPEWVTQMGNAKIYTTEQAAKGQLTRARKHRPFEHARVVQVGLVETIG